MSESKTFAFLLFFSISLELNVLSKKKKSRIYPFKFTILSTAMVTTINICSRVSDTFQLMSDHTMSFGVSIFTLYVEEEAEVEIDEW